MVRGPRNEGDLQAIVDGLKVKSFNGVQSLT